MKADRFGNERLIGLTDGAFAIVLTLLVLPLIEFATPERIGRLNLENILEESGRLFYLYLIAFVVISKYWTKHHAVFRYVSQCNTTLLWLNLWLIFWVSLMPFVNVLIGSYKIEEHAEQISDQEIITLALIYNAVMILAGLTQVWMWRYAARHRRLIDKDVSQRIVTYQTLSILLVPAVFLLSTIFLFVNLTTAYIFYLLAFVIDIPLPRLYPPVKTQ